MTYLREKKCQCGKKKMVFGYTHRGKPRSHLACSRCDCADSWKTTPNTQSANDGA